MNVTSIYLMPIYIYYYRVKVCVYVCVLGGGEETE